MRRSLIDKHNLSGYVQNMIDKGYSLSQMKKHIKKEKGVDISITSLHRWVSLETQAGYEKELKRIEEADVLTLEDYVLEFWYKSLRKIGVGTRKYKLVDNDRKIIEKRVKQIQDRINRLESVDKEKVIRKMLRDFCSPLCNDCKKKVSNLADEKLEAGDVYY